MAECPECDADLDELDEYEELEVGDTVPCPQCNVELKIVGSSPLAVATAD